MRLGTFLEHRADQILQETIAFARSLKPLQHCDDKELRDHFSEILVTITADLKQPQSRAESIEKSQGRGPVAPEESAAQSHGVARAESGLSMTQVYAEYRALRSCVLRLWTEQHAFADGAEKDLIRFNEAIDQAVQESVASYEKEVEHLRQLFLGVLSHDLRGPLHAIALTTSLIERQAEGSVTCSAAVLSKSVKRMTTLLDSLLEMNRANLGAGMSLDKSTTDLGLQCQAEIDVLQAAYPGSRLHVTAHGDLTGDFDSSRVCEALSNLVTNAVKHASDKDDVTIDLKGDEATVRIVVENAGEIPSADAKGLFEPLRRGSGAHQSNERSNLGLGLFITRQIARAHGGDVELHSEAGRVRFTLILPKTESQPAAPLP